MLERLKTIFRRERGTLHDRPQPQAEHYLREWGIKYARRPGNMLEVFDLNISNKGLTELPDLSRVTVTNTFDCSGNQLETLKGCPKKANNILCGRNRLVSLEGVPGAVNGYFDCSGNALETLEGGPTSAHYFGCDNNKLLSLKGGPGSVGHTLSCLGNPMETFEGMPAYYYEFKSDYGAFDNAYHRVPQKLLRPVEETAAYQAAKRDRAKNPGPAARKNSGFRL